MANPKKAHSPLPETVWYSAGTARVAGAPEMVQRRLEELTAAGTVEEFFRDDDLCDPDVPSSMFQARWRPEAHATIRARIAVIGIGEDQYFWDVLAEASRPWNWDWASPATMFWPKSLKIEWDFAGRSGRMRYRLPSPIGANDVARVNVQAALSAQSDIHVFTHDDRRLEHGRPLVPLVRYLPPSFLGRLIEHYVPSWILSTVNRELKQAGLHLPPGGALLVPQRSGKGRAGPAEVIDDAFAAGRPEALIDSIVRQGDVPRWVEPYVHDQLDLLREQFVLVTDQEVVEGLERDLQAAQVKLTDALQAQEALRKELQETGALLEEARAERESSRRREEEAQREGERLQEELKEAHSVIEKMRHEASTSDLGQSLRAAEDRCEAAELGTEAAEDLLDEQIREISWLRKQLASAGQPTAATPPTAACPESWEGLVERAENELDRVILGDVLATSRSLRDHTAEATWRQRTWDALRALNAYAHARVEHGPELLPHLSAYLSWRDAPVPLPRSRYSPSESQLVLNTPRLREERMLPVPRDVHPSGRVLMAQHIRIGSGKPPAPRMHLYDNTAGDGRVYVGYVGEHLRNTHTN